MKNKKIAKKTHNKENRETLTREGFLKMLDKVILTVKPSKSPARGKSKTSE